MLADQRCLINPSYFMGFCCCCSLSCVQVFVTPWTAACQASLSFTMSQSLLKFTSISWLCYLTISSSAILFSFCLKSFPASRSFPKNQLFASDGQSIGVPASASVLPVDIWGWFPLGWTGWISLQSKGLSRVFSNNTGQNINSSALSFLHSLILTSIHDYWKNHSLD